MEIRKICLEDRAAFERFEVALLEDKKINPFVEWRKVENFDDMVSHSDISELKQTGQTWSPFTRYFAFLDGEIVGFVSCFWEIDHPDCQRLGHLSYTVAPAFRGKGIASHLAQYAISCYREKGVKRIHIAMDEDNVPSRKTAERAGGQFLGIFDIEYNHQKVRSAKYEVRL